MRFERVRTWTIERRAARIECAVGIEAVKAGAQAANQGNVLRHPFLRLGREHHAVHPAVDVACPARAIASAPRIFIHGADEGIDDPGDRCGLVVDRVSLEFQAAFGTVPRRASAAAIIESSDKSLCVDRGDTSLSGPLGMLRGTIVCAPELRVTLDAFPPGSIGRFRPGVADRTAGEPTRVGRHEHVVKFAGRVGDTETRECRDRPSSR